jgi:outer membrane receptor protein involved in Fe transport
LISWVTNEASDGAENWAGVASLIETCKRTTSAHIDVAREHGTFAARTGDAGSIQSPEQCVREIAPAKEQIVVTGQAASLRRAPAAGKTGAALADLPVSVQLIERGTIEAQGGVSLQDAIVNASDVGGGGFGFYDRFLIRGLDARIYSDGFSDGNQRNGLPHSLNGVEQIEIFKGPGSSLFGSGPPGGSINIVHYVPSERDAAGGGWQIGSFDTINANAYAASSIGVPGLSYRVDGQTQIRMAFAICRATTTRSGSRSRGAHRPTRLSSASMRAGSRRHPIQRGSRAL